MQKVVDNTPVSQVSMARVHGGALSQGRRKSMRPLSYHRRIYLVMSASMARDRFSMKSPRVKTKIEQILRGQALKFGVRIEHIGQGGQRLELILRTPQRVSFQNFLRSSSAMIARKVTGARKGQPFGKFWDHLALTQILGSNFEKRFKNSSSGSGGQLPSGLNSILPVLQFWLIQNHHLDST